jgi:hypothetical protein
MTVILSPPDQRITLRNLSWETYRRLLSEHGGVSSSRRTFDRGVLEIMSPSAEHERHNLRIADLIGVIADAMNFEAEGLGASTFTREDLERAFEADSCFYVQNVDKIRKKECTDLGTDPPLTWWLRSISPIPRLTNSCCSGVTTASGWKFFDCRVLGTRQVRRAWRFLEFLQRR